MVDVKKVTSGFSLNSALGFAQITKTPGIPVETVVRYPNGLADFSKTERDPFLSLQQTTINGITRYGFRIPFSRIYEVTFNVYPLLFVGGNPGFSNVWTNNTISEIYSVIEIYDSNNSAANRDSWADIFIPGKIEIYYGNYTRLVFGTTRRYYSLFAGDFVTFYVGHSLYDVELNQSYTLYAADGRNGPILTGSLTEITDL